MDPLCMSHVKQYGQKQKKGMLDSQSESFIIFGSPAVVLGLGGILPLLVAKERTDDVDFNKGPEDS